MNDIIFFDLVTEEDGKTKAINATIEGVAVRTFQSKSKRPKKKSNFVSNVFFLIIAFGFLVGAYITYPKLSPKIVESIPVNLVKEDFSGFKCESKQYCGQMTSCKEARFYLKTCPNVKIDGNNDGVPCESQWCN